MMNRPATSMRRRGVTLIELFVILPVVMIVLAISIRCVQQYQAFDRGQQIERYHRQQMKRLIRDFRADASAANKAKVTSDGIQFFDQDDRMTSQYRVKTGERTFVVRPPERYPIAQRWSVSFERSSETDVLSRVCTIKFSNSDLAAPPIRAIAVLAERTSNERSQESPNGSSQESPNERSQESPNGSSQADSSDDEGGGQ